MNIRLKHVLAAPACAALFALSSHAGAADPVYEGKAGSRVEKLATESVGMEAVRASHAQPSAAGVSGQTERNAPAANVPASAVPAKTIADPDTSDARLDNYRLELNNCCGPEER